MGTYSPLVDYVAISPNRTVPRNAPIDTITPHCVAGNLTVETLGNCFAPSSRQASSHYGIGSDGRIACYCYEENRSWCTSSMSNDNRAITIEVSNDGGEPDWHISDAALASLIKLSACIAKRHGIAELKWEADSNLIATISRQNMTVHRWFAAKACVPIDSEVLTRSGWKTIESVQVGEEIACPDLNMNITFEKIYQKVPIKRQDTYTNNGLTATKDHRMVYFTHSNGNCRIEFYNNLLKDTRGIFIPMAGSYRDAKGLDVSNTMLRFLIATQADGHYMYHHNKNGKSYHGLQFHLKKKRKISAILYILNELKFPHRINKKSDGSVSICVYNDKATGFDIVALCESHLTNKCFNWKFIEMSRVQAMSFLSEILDWDGCRVANSYHSSEKINMDVVSAIASLNGVGSKVSSDGRSIIFRERPYISLGVEEKSTVHNTSRTPNTKNTVTCVSVPTGIFLMRQNGKTFVIGNCPGDYIYGKMSYIADEANKLIKGVDTVATVSNEQLIWDALAGKGFNDCAIAGIMGNLYMESGLLPNNLQNTYETKFGMNDDQYTEAVDNGTYTNFVNDSAGYGLCQWTWYTRKQGLYDLAKSMGKSIADIDVQIAWLFVELEKYATAIAGLKTCTTVKEASDLFMVEFLAPANTSDEAKTKRAAAGQTYYDKLGGGGAGEVSTAPSISVEESIVNKSIVVQSLTNVQVAAIQTKRESKELLDLKSGKKFNISWAAAATYHSDWTPMTSADVDIIKSILDPTMSRNWNNVNSWSWDGRPGVLKLNDSTYVACGFHLRPHAALMGGNPGSPFTNQSNTRPATGWALGGHMCMYYGDSVGGTPSCNTAAKEAVALGNAYYQGVSAPESSVVVPSVEATDVASYIVKVTTSSLNVRSGPGTNYGVSKSIRDYGCYTIVAESTGTGATKWGKLKSGDGWIALDYTRKI